MEVSKKTQIIVGVVAVSYIAYLVWKKNSGDGIWANASGKKKGKIFANAKGRK
jgi:hypothetical protein